MKHIKSFFFKKPVFKKISSRLTLAFSLIFLIVFCIFFVITSSLFSDKLTEEMHVVASQQLDFAGSLLSNTIEEIRSFYYSLVKLDTMQNFLKPSRFPQNNPGAAEQNLIKKEMSIHKNNTGLNIRSLFVISKDKKILDPLYSSDSYSWLVQENPEFEHFLTSQLTLKFSAPNTFPFKNKSEEFPLNPTLTCFGKVYDKYTYEDLGYLAINLNHAAVFSRIDELLKNTFAKTYVVDEFSNIIYQNSPLEEPYELLLSKDYPSSGQHVKIDNRSYIAYSCTVGGYPNWKIIGFIDYQEIYKPIRNIYLTMFIILLIFILLTVITTYYSARSITVPIKEISLAMKHLGSGDWPALLESRTCDEMSQLIDGFNKMNLSLQDMTQEIARQQEQARKDEIALMQSQLDLLESQINPHFIHNTLNTLRYLAKLSHADKLADLIGSFNALLRTSMAQDNMLITLAEEVDNLNHYMDIQRERYDVPIDFIYDISEESRMIKLPKLILQPLVENSLFHGIVPNGGGLIRVSAEVTEGRLWIRVLDNGTGIPEDKLRRIIAGDPCTHKGYNKIGIANVNDRLLLNYGASSHLVIESSPSKGTSCSFSIPIIS